MAQDPEIDHAPQGDAGQQVEPHLPPARYGGVDKDARRHHQPEQQIQQTAYQGQGETDPQDPQHVVHQANGGAQRHRPRQKEGLFRDRDLHLSGRAGRKSRLRPGPGCPHR